MKAMEKLDTKRLEQVNKANAHVMGRVFFRMAEEYSFKNSEIATILDVTMASVSNLKRDKMLPLKAEAFARTGQLLGIKKTLEIMFPRNPEVKSKWLQRQREVFKGKSALELICEDKFRTGERLFKVRRVLDLWRNGLILELT